jgi:glyoxylase-like metal-dependent hydrolase (beta-lactamase superfamily II)
VPVLLAAWLAVTLMAGQKKEMPPAAAGTAPAELQKLGDGVFVHLVNPDSEAVANCGVVVLESGVLLFDTHFTPEAGQALEELIKGVTGLPVRYLVNSHFHPDHTHGNQAFASARHIIGSTLTRRDMLQKDMPALNRMQIIAQGQVVKLGREISQEKDPGKQESLRLQLKMHQAFMRRLSSLKILAPVMTLDDSLSIVDSGREVNLLYLGAGHTEGDVVFYLPEEKIAFLGDLFFNDALPSVEDASLLEWMKTLRAVLQLDVRTYVPGHGRVGSRQDVEEFLGYLEDLKALVEPAVKRGDSLEQVVHDLRLPPKYATFSFQSFFPANLQKMYAELKAAQAAAAPEHAIKKGARP